MVLSACSPGAEIPPFAYRPPFVTPQAEKVKLMTISSEGESSFYEYDPREFPPVSEHVSAKVVQEDFSAYALVPSPPFSLPRPATGWRLLARGNSMTLAFVTAVEKGAAFVNVSKASPYPLLDTEALPVPAQGGFDSASPSPALKLHSPLLMLDGFRVKFLVVADLVVPGDGTDGFFRVISVFDADDLPDENESGRGDLERLKRGFGMAAGQIYEKVF